MEFAVEVERLSRQFGEFRALDDVSLSIRAGEFFSLLGPSGCGKTTLLRLVAGLDLPDSGQIRIGGVDARKIPAHRRPVNTVFQSYALFPHLTVRDNVAFGLRMKRVDRDEIVWRVDRTLEMVRIIDYADRKPAQLSGGQKQRVALARALVNEPQVLLLDEPLGALDLKLRKELQVELLALQRRLGITFIFVTHDQEEALVMSDRIAVMRAGKIEQLGDSETLYERPATRFTGQFLGTCNLLEGTVGAAMPGELLVETAQGPIRVDRAKEPSPGRSLPVRGAVTLAIRPEKVRLYAPGEGPAENRVAATVHEIVYVGSMTQYLLAPRSGSDPSGTDEPAGLLSAWTINSSPGAGGFAIGENIAAVFPPASLVVLED